MLCFGTYDGDTSADRIGSFVHLDSKVPVVISGVEQSLRSAFVAVRSPDLCASTRLAILVALMLILPPRMLVFSVVCAAA